MTRINYGVHPCDLIDKLVKAELREIKRVPGNLRLRLERGIPMDDIPERFTLNKGHVLYFLDKGEYTYNRYLLLQEEMILRGFSFTDYSANWDIYEEYPEYYNTVPSQPHGFEAIEERLIERINGYKTPNRYYGREITTEESIKLFQHPHFHLILKRRFNIE